MLYSKFDGFISRILLVSPSGVYVGIVQHKNKDTFMKMESSKERNELRKKVLPVFKAEPKPSFYEEVEL